MVKSLVKELGRPTFGYRMMSITELQMGKKKWKGEARNPMKHNNGFNWYLTTNQLHEKTNIEKYNIVVALYCDRYGDPTAMEVTGSAINQDSRREKIEQLIEEVQAGKMNGHVIPEGRDRSREREEK